MKPPWMIRRDGSCLKRSSSFISLFCHFRFFSFLEVGEIVSCSEGGKINSLFLYLSSTRTKGARGGGGKKEREIGFSLFFGTGLTNCHIFFSSGGGGRKSIFLVSFLFLAAYGQKRVPPRKKEGPTSKRQTASRFPYEKNNKCFFFSRWDEGGVSASSSSISYRSVTQPQKLTNFLSRPSLSPLPHSKNTTFFFNGGRGKARVCSSLPLSSWF